jgi:hypothetical protein
MAERILTRRELNRAALARQSLLDRASLSALDALKSLAGLQAQLPNPPYIGLWTRLRSFQRHDLTRLLDERQAVRATMMRATLHLMAATDYLLFRPALQPALTRAMYGFFGSRAKQLNVEQIVAAARAYLQEQPRTFAEIRARLVEVFPDTDPALMTYAVRTHLPLVQVPSNDAWGFASNPAYAEASDWLGRPLAAPSEGLHPLILRYLAAFGPATVKDIQVWSGLSRLSDVVKALKPDLCTFRDEEGNELLDLPGSPRPPADVAAPPRFLPEFDNLVLAHADRRRIVPEEYRGSIVLPPGRILATFLIDGFVCGTWKIERTHDEAKLVIVPFEPLPDKAHDELVEEGERLIRFVEDDAATYKIQFAPATAVKE